MDWGEAELDILREKYPEQGYQIPELLENGRTKGSLNQMAFRKGITWNNDLKRIKIEGRLKEIVDGLMLGDGCIHTPARGKKTGILALAQTESKKQWLIDAAKELKKQGLQTKLGVSYKKRRIIFCGREVNTQSAFRIQTLSYVDFVDERKKWGYNPKKSQIPEDVSLSPLTLAYWYMGDGSLILRKDKRFPNYHGFRINFSTECFNRESLKQFKEKLEQKYGWKICLNNHACGLPVLNINRKNDVIDFLKITRPYMSNCFSYKWRAIL